MNSQADYKRIGAEKEEAARRLDEMVPHGPWREQFGREWREFSSAQKKQREALAARVEQCDTALNALLRTF